jgi:hypothetical protein
MNSREWLDARLQLVIKECNSKLLGDTNLDEDDKEEIGNSLALANQLQDSIKVFFPTESDTGASCLHHPDLSFDNFLVDKDGGLTAILDWGCAHAAPLWKAYEFPNRAEYYRPSPEAVRVGRKMTSSKSICSSLEYEQKTLRGVFKNEMN